MKKPRQYGQWAGNPVGVAEDPAKCVAEVRDGWHSCQCSRPRGHGPDQEYCRQHDPDRKAAKESKRAQANQQKAAEEEAIRREGQALAARLGCGEVYYFIPYNRTGMGAYVRKLIITFEEAETLEKRR